MIEYVPDSKSVKAEVDRLRGQELEKLKHLDEIRLSKNSTEARLEQSRDRIMKLEYIQKEMRNSDNLQKSRKELLHLKSVEQNLEFKINQLKKEAESVATQVTILSGKQCQLLNDLQANGTIKQVMEEENKAQLEEIETQKLSFQEQLPPRYLSLYKRIRANRGGIAIAIVFGNSCGGCHMVFPAQFVIELSRSSDIGQCLACQRLLLVSREGKNMNES
jgi:predicted  nucleic acid-binding Zn-ribbon protein